APPPRTVPRGSAHPPEPRGTPRRKVHPLTTNEPPAPSPAPHPAQQLEQALFEAKRVLVGQDHMIERLFVCWLARGHCLLERPPGLAKTLAAETMARILGGAVARLQFTPDLVPADPLGTRHYPPSREGVARARRPVVA